MIAGVRLSDLNAAATHFCQRCRAMVGQLHVTPVEELPAAELLRLRTMVCKNLGITVEGLVCRSNAAVYVARRRAFAVQARKLGFGWRDIGRSILRDHTTALYLVRGKKARNRGEE